MSVVSAFQNLKVKAKVVIAVTCVLATMVALGLFSVQRLTDVDAHAESVKDNWLPSVRTLGFMNYYTVRARQKQAAYLLETTDAGRANERKLVDEMIAGADDQVRIYEPMVSPGRERALADQFLPRWQSYVTSQAQLEELVRTKGQAAAFAYYNGPMLDTFNAMSKALNEDLTYNADSGKAEAVAGEDAFHSARTWIFIAIGLGALLSAIAGFLLVSAVSGPLGIITRVMGLIAGGDLQVDVPNADRKDEIGSLAQGLVAFKNQLAEAERERITAMAAFQAIGRSQATIEFDLDGKILTANENFLATVGYSLSDIVGRPHAMFVEPDYARGNEYRAFWERLNRGEPMSGKFKRIGRDGKEVWIQASYNPLLGKDGKPFKVIKFAIDVSHVEKEIQAAEASKIQQTKIIVESVGAGLDALAKGDLVHRVTADLTGPFAKLKDDFNGALSRLQETMQTVLSSTAGISTGAGEISQAADDLSKRTEQQAASLEETAAALEEITATVKKTAQNAKEASTIVTTAKTAAEDGGRVVETAIQAMGQIAQSSKQITDIIGVIDEIAFQTNLLALNAGVEAARAGDAGKGFAVVASEVRALAQRSSEAAREIKTLIKTSGEQVDSGVRLVGESGAALKRIVDQVVEINSLVTEMAQAAQQQSTGIEEVNVAVSQMDQVTQQNAAMVEQSTAASRNLANETTDLSNLVSFFQVAQKSAGATVRQMHAPAKPAPRPVAKAQPRQAVAGGRRAPAVAAAEDDWQEF